MEWNISIYDCMGTGELEKPHNNNSCISTVLLQPRPVIHAVHTPQLKGPLRIVQILCIIIYFEMISSFRCSGMITLTEIRESSDQRCSY